MNPLDSYYLLVYPVLYETTWAETQVYIQMSEIQTQPIDESTNIRLRKKFNSVHLFASVIP